MKNIKTIVFQSVGHASMCWSETPKGIFDDKEATKVGNNLMDEINSYAARFAEWIYLNDYIVVNESDLKFYWAKGGESVAKPTEKLLELFNE